MRPEIASLRREYAHQYLLEHDVASDPIQQFDIWWKQIIESEVIEPNAMTLATASCDGMPSARVVLLKGFNQTGFSFFTNYKSFKAMQLKENPKACLVFYWKELERQVRIIGLVSKLPDQDNDEYFLSRPEGSRIGAWASPQSQVIENRSWIDENFEKVKIELGEQALKCPEHWGGYIVKPVIVEFWQGRPSRLHDRIQYSVMEDGNWRVERLAP